MGFMIKGKERAGFTWQPAQEREKWNWTSFHDIINKPKKKKKRRHDSKQILQNLLNI